MADDDGDGLLTMTREGCLVILALAAACWALLIGAGWLVYGWFAQ